MPHILVVDDMDIFRDPIAASLQLAGHTTRVAAGGREAMVMMRASRPDLVLLDLSMPDVDGLTVLRELRREPALAGLPVILLTALSEKRCVLEAAKLGVKDYLLKSRFSTKGLLERVDRCIKEAQTPPPAPAPAPAATPQVAATAQAPSLPLVSTQPARAPQLMTRDECLTRAEAALQAKTLSGIVAQVISAAASPRSDLTQLAGLVGKDAVLSARVLQTANSAAYAANRGPVTTIPDAVRKVGSATIRNLAAAMGIFDAMPEASADGFDPIRCWQHSFAVATLCETLAARSDPALAGPAYLVGLCHDLGEIFFHTHFGPELRQVLAEQTRTGRRRDQLERDMLGITHGELVLTILRCMGLPDGIRRPIEDLHASAGAAPKDPIARVLRVANQYANGLLLASSLDARIAPLARAECRAACGEENPPAPQTETFRCEIVALATSLARLSSADERRLAQSMLPPSSTRIWLARDRVYSAFDPLAAALAALAEPEVSDRLPEEHELESCDAVIVATPSDSSDLAQGLSAGLRRPDGTRVPVLWICGRAGASPCEGVARHERAVSLEALSRFITAAAAANQQQPVLA